MTRLTDTNAQYYLLVGLMQDSMFSKLDHCLQRDMQALVGPGPRDRWSTRDDVHSLAGHVIRCFEKAGVQAVAALGDEGDYNPDGDKGQIVKDLFALHKAVREFVELTWHSEPTQQSSMDDLLEKAYAAAVHSRTVLRSDVHKRVLMGV